LAGDVTIYFFMWYFFFIMTYGISVPAGVFVPGMLIGCSLGMMYLDLLMTGFNINLMRLGGESYLILGSAAMLASYTRLTYSLAVIIIETTQSINLFIPVMITIFISYGVARMFNRSLYEMSIRSKSLPVLRDLIPAESQNVRVRDLIKELFDPKKGYELETVPEVCKVSKLAQVL
jgi:chloride channel 7